MGFVKAEGGFHAQVVAVWLYQLVTLSAYCALQAVSWARASQQLPALSTLGHPLDLTQ